MTIIILTAVSAVCSAFALAVFSTLIGTNFFGVGYEKTLKFGFIAGLLASPSFVGAAFAFSGDQAALHTACWILGISLGGLLAFLLFLVVRRAKM